MRSAWLKRIGMVVAAAGVMAASARGQVNPHTNIKWPANCSGAGMVYSFAVNDCVASGTAANPAGLRWQIQFNNNGIFGGSLATLDAAGNLNTPLTVTAGATVVPLWVDARAAQFAGGAKCDGVTDDTAALNAAAAATGTLGTPSQPWGLYIPNTGKACLTSTGIVMPTFNNQPVYVRVDGTLRATASQTSLISVGSPSAYSAGGEISGGGTLDANGYAQNAIWLHQVEDFNVDDLNINNATVAGVHIGDPLTPAASYGVWVRNNRFTVEDLTAVPPTFINKTAGSYGVFMENTADNHIDGNFIQGYDFGVLTTGGNSPITNNHCWGHSNQIPTTCYIDNGNGVLWFNDYADGPLVSGFHLKGFRDTVIAPRIFCSQFCPTNTVVGIQFDQTSPGATVENGFFSGGPSNVLLADVSGTDSALRSLRLGGNISGGFIATTNAIQREQIPDDASIKDSIFGHYTGGTFPSLIASSQFSFPAITAGVITFPSSGTNSAGNLFATDSNGNTTLVNIPNSGATPATLDLTTWTAAQPPSTWIYKQMTGFGQHWWNATNSSQPWTYAFQKSGTVVLGYNLAGQWVIPSLNAAGVVTNTSAGILGTKVLPDNTMSLMLYGPITSTFTSDLWPALVQPITVVAAQVNLLSAAPTGCATYPVLNVWDSTAGASIASVTTAPAAAATITAYSTSTNTVTLTATNSFSAGQLVSFSVSVGPTYLNGTSAAVLASGLSGSQFSVSFTGAAGSGSATGTATGTSSYAMTINISSIAATHVIAARVSTAPVTCGVNANTAKINVQYH